MKEKVIYLIAIIIATTVMLIIKYFTIGHIDLWSVISSLFVGIAAIGAVWWLNSRKKRSK